MSEKRDVILEKYSNGELKRGCFMYLSLREIDLIYKWYVSAHHKEVPCAVSMGACRELNRRLHSAYVYVEKQRSEQFRQRRQQNEDK